MAKAIVLAYDHKGASTWRDVRDYVLSIPEADRGGRLSTFKSWHSQLTRLGVIVPEGWDLSSADPTIVGEWDRHDIEPTFTPSEANLPWRAPGSPSIFLHNSGPVEIRNVRTRFGYVDQLRTIPAIPPGDCRELVLEGGLDSLYPPHEVANWVALSEFSAPPVPSWWPQEQGSRPHVVELWVRLTITFTMGRGIRRLTVMLLYDDGRWEKVGSADGSSWAPIR